MTTNEEIILSAIADAKPGDKVEISGLAEGTDGTHEVVAEGPQYKTTLTPEQIDAAQGEIKDRSFSGRNPHLGKMINCQVCSTRHREGERKCVQKFTYRVGDYEYFKEEKNEEGETKLVPAYRTSMDASVAAVGKPTKGSIMGKSPRPNAFVGPRVKPHHSRATLQFIKLVREVFTAWEEKFNENLARVADDMQEKLQDAYNQQAQDMLHRARIIAGRKITKLNGWKKGENTRRQVQSMRSRGNIG